MDKYEYKVRAEEIKALIAEGEFAEAVKIADTIDWRRVKSVMMLCTISDLYKINRRFQESKDILLMAYERHPGGRLIVYSLCELSVKMGEYVQAIEYYKEFVQIAPKDTGRYILQYKLYEAQDVSLEERIAVLEEFKKRDYREKWAYELAYLYHRVGLETKCVEECDEMILWFGEGRYVIKALELKQLHHTLTPDQQEKYLLFKREREIQEAQLAAREKQQEEESAKIAEFPEYTAQNNDNDEEEEEFRVKTVDVGQYNTINLQKELAKSMKELLGEDAQSNTMETPHTSSVNFASFHEESEPSVQSTPAVPHVAAIHPVLDAQNTAADDSALNVQNIPAAPSPSASDIPPQPPQSQSAEEQTAMEEVFFEDVKDILLEDTKEINIKEVSSGNLSDTKELHPGRRVIYPAVVSSVSIPPTPMQSIPSHQLKATIKPSGFEQMLSQEYDGQISLAVPEGNQLEKQITGQMNITDIMAEWEKMKKENKEKRSEDVRRRVEQHTGNMFSEFDEATKKGLLEQLEKAVVEAILKEAGKKSVNPEEIPDARLSDMVVAAEKSAMQSTSDDADTGSENNEVEEPAVQAEKATQAVTLPQEPVTPQALEAIETDTQVPEAVPLEDKNDADQIIDLETVSLGMEPANTAERVVGMVEDANRLRPLSNEEKELFGNFIYNKKAKEQIIQAVDTMSMDAFTDNVIITGEEGTGTIELAKNLIRMMQMSDSNFSGKVAKISGATLKKKNVEETLSHLTDGALIIERATEMSSATAADLKNALSKENSGLLVIMEGKKDEMNIFLRKNHILSENFNARIDIEALGDHALVEYAKQYAEEMEYTIDNLGILALHTRIADMQTSDHEVTVAEVKELVDDAIYFADKKNLRHLCDILVGKRYDEEDMIILRENDFMHY